MPQLCQPRNQGQCHLIIIFLGLSIANLLHCEFNERLRQPPFQTHSVAYDIDLGGTLDTQQLPRIELLHSVLVVIDIMSLLDAAGMVTGDIWCSGAFSFESPLKDLLDSGDYTLEQLLAEDELLQEVRGMHPQLIEFFSSEESVTGLIKYVILKSQEQQQRNAKEKTGQTEPKENDVQTAAQDVTTKEEEKKPDGTKAVESLVDIDIKEEDENYKEEGQNGENPVSEAEPEPSIEDKDLSEPHPPVEPGQWLQADDAADTAENGQDYALQHTQPPSEKEEKAALHIRYPYMACEVICCEIKGIIDILVDGFVPEGTAISEDGDEVPDGDGRRRPILDLLFSMLYEEQEGAVDDYRAGYFDKILSILFRKRPQALSQYINSGGGNGRAALMSAMFRHLYSHSIMQIVQRLLLPQPQAPPLPQSDDGVQEDENKEDGQNMYSDSLEITGDLDGLGSFRCDWAESPEAIEMVLDCLIGDKAPPGIQEDQERQLSLYQNASEVLITIIQNSPLTSSTLHSLTTDPVLERLVLAATQVDKGSSFSHHDSRLTCAMNVLESLILQLGGYGSVGTMVFPGEEDEDELGNAAGVVEEQVYGDEGESDPPPRAPDPDSDSSSPEQEQPQPHPQIEEEVPPDYATPDTLIQHLPTMLSSLSELLLDKQAEQWLSPMQFSTEPQKILGSSRLRIVRLLESLVLLGDPVVDLILCESKCLEICLDLFWKFQWCSMLHQSVANLLVHVFEGQNARSELQSYFVVKCNLLGRLIDSFWGGTEEGITSTAGDAHSAKLSEDLMALKNGVNPLSSSLASEKGSSDEILPVSDDDVDAAMEQQESSSSPDNPLEDETSPALVMDSAASSGPEAHGVPDRTTAQSFRLGYMGHVIIICQALVHACTNDGKSEAPSVSIAGGGTQSEMNGGDLENFVGKMNGQEDTEPTPQPNSRPLAEALERGRAGESVATDETMGSIPLVLAQLVDSHPLSKNWQDFISSTLASETAIQSSPLGGYQNPAPGMDPLHAHRPGLPDEDGYDDDDGAAPPLPPRGLLVGGDVIDMDDNDLDVAASMMAGLSLGRAADADNPSDRDLLAGIPSQSRGASGTGYMFDDPLGGRQFGKFDDDDDDDDDSSSDEESEQSGNTGDSGSAVLDGVPLENASAEEDAPVMDLFAGNLDAFEDNSAPQANSDANWSDFANFDDAFAGAPTMEDNLALEPDSSNFDSVFGEVKKDHAMLLEELDNPPSMMQEKESKLNDEDPVSVGLHSIPREETARVS